MKFLLILLMCFTTLAYAKTTDSNLNVSLTVLPAHKHKKHKPKIKNYKIKRKGNIKTIYY